MRKKKLLAFLALLSVMLFPSVAWAGPADQVYGLAKRIWDSIVGPALLPYASYGDWGVVLSVVCVGLTFFGLWKVEKFRLYAGKISGFGILPIALMIMWMIIGMGIGLALGLIKGGISSLWNMVPIINLFPRLVAFLSKITWYVVAFFLIIALIKHLLSAGFGYIKEFMTIVKNIIVGPFQGETKPVHMVIGVFIVTAIINRPEINEATLYIPSGLGSVFGLYMFFTRTVLGKKAAGKAASRIKHGPLPDDDPERPGWWPCPNWGMKALLDREGNRVPVPGKKKKYRAKKVFCKGPGGEYKGYNPKDAPYCMCDRCDYPNPDWIKCTKQGCGWAGEDKLGFRRQKRGTHQKCPKCGTNYPPPPDHTGFHEPGEDKMHAGTPGAPPPPTAAQPASPKQPSQVIDGKIEMPTWTGQPAPFDMSNVQLDHGDDIMTGPSQFWVATGTCSCGAEINPLFSSKVCVECGKKVDQPTSDKKRVKRKDLGPKMKPNSFLYDCGRTIN
jgi:hypothetical protein